MTYKIKAEKLTSNFVMIPNALAQDHSILHETRTFLIWLQSQPDGFEITAARCREEMRLSIYKWKMVRKELTQRNAVYRQPHRNKNGAITRWNLIVTIKPWINGTPPTKKQKTSQRPYMAEINNKVENRSPCSKNPPLGGRKSTHKRVENRPCINNTKNISRTGEPTLAEKHKIAQRNHECGLKWFEPTSGKEMPVSEKPKSLFHYQKLMEL